MKKEEFIIGGYVWHEAVNQFFTVEIAQLLNQNLLLSDYSEDVKEYLVRAIALTPVGSPPKHFSIKTKILHNFYVIDWQDLMKLNQQQAISLQAKMYLEAIKEIPNIRGMKKRQFNAELFYHDVELLFKKEKLIID